MRLLRPLVVALLVLAAAEGARAVDLRDVLADYTLTSWSRKDGLTGPVWAIAQDADGFLWLGNEEGLVRFDGVRFVQWNAVGGPSLPQSPVRTIRVANDGALWLGLGGAGGVVRVRKGAVDRFTDDRFAP